MQGEWINNMDILITKAKNSDSTQITDLIFNIWTNEYFFKVNKEDYPDLANPEIYAEKGGSFLVARTSDQVVGTIATEKLADQVFILKRMFVRKDLRGQGLAQKLLDKIFALQGSGTYYLSTKEDLAIAAKKFYLKNSFERITREELPAGFPFFYEDDLFMKASK